MKVAVGNDHRGLAVKYRVVGLLAELGHEIHDLGATGPAGVDYPDYAIPVGEEICAGKADRGILICATGHGMCIAANKVPGVRAALAWSLETAGLGREHNDANVISVGARMHTVAEAVSFVERFLETPFSGGERHIRRIDMLSDYEKAHELPPVPGDATLDGAHPELPDA